MKVAYVRVSSIDQNEERQINALEPHRIEKYFLDKVSGKDRNRPQLQSMLEFVRQGDVIYTESISRLARSSFDFLNILKELETKAVHLVSLKESFDTGSPQGKFILTVFGALYELERESIKQRQVVGISNALEKGVKFGRPKQEITEEFKKTYHQWKKGQITATAAMRILSMKPNTFYRRVKEYENK